MVLWGKVWDGWGYYIQCSINRKRRKMSQSELNPEIKKTKLVLENFCQKMIIFKGCPTKVVTRPDVDNVSEKGKKCDDHCEPATSRNW